MMNKNEIILQSEIYLLELNSSLNIEDILTPNFLGLGFGNPTNAKIIPPRSVLTSARWY